MARKRNKNRAALDYKHYSEGRLHEKALSLAVRLGFETPPMHGHTPTSIRQGQRPAIRCVECDIIVASVRDDVIGIAKDWFEAALTSHALNKHPMQNPDSITYEFGVIQG